MPATVTHTLLICSDCVVIAANGTDGHCEDCHPLGLYESSVCTYMSKAIAGLTRTLPMLADAGLVPGEYAGFQHSSCEGCGSVLSGDRWDAVIVSG